MLIAVPKICLRGSVEELLEGLFGLVDDELLIFELNEDDRNVDGSYVRHVILRSADGARLSILAVVEAFHECAAPLFGYILSFS